MFLIYGLGLFTVFPFVTGFVSVAIFNARRRHSAAACTAVALGSLAGIGFLLLALGIEGVICLFMAAPLSLLVALLGGAAAYNLRRPIPQGAVCLMILVPPGVSFTEARISRKAPVFQVTSAIDIAAPPETVWRNVIEFSDLPREREWLFHTGIAYPLRAKITGRGAGAIRECIFSTGPFIEPIEVWDAPRLLRFSVTSNPAPMQELSPYGAIHPPHLDGYMVSKRGQFKLIPLGGGGTRLEGTTWYQHHLWPASYWTLWSDQIIHRIHMRVLNHVKNLSENQVR